MTDENEHTSNRNGSEEAFDPDLELEFPEPESAEVNIVFCPHCDEDVIPQDDGRCPKCDGMIVS
jgi:hypothetical protein